MRSAAARGARNILWQGYVRGRAARKSSAATVPAPGPSAIDLSSLIIIIKGQLTYNDTQTHTTHRLLLQLHNMPMHVEGCRMCGLRGEECGGRVMVLTTGSL